MEKTKKKKIIKGIFGILGVILVYLGFIFIRGYLERTRVIEEAAEVIATEEDTENYKYLKLKLKANLELEYLFRQKTREKLAETVLDLEKSLEEINTAKLGKVYLEDHKNLEEEIKDLEEVLAKSGDEADIQLEFMKQVEKHSGRNKINYYISRVAFSKPTGGLDEFGVFLLNGAKILLLEREEGVEVFLGGEEGVGITTGELARSGLLEAKGEVFSVNRKNGERIKLGEGLSEVLEKGRLKVFKTDFSGKKIIKTEIFLRGKGTWDLEEELGGREITGLVGEEYIKNSIPETLLEITKKIEEE